MTVDTTFNGSITVECVNPSNKRVPVEFDFTNGVHQETFVPTEWGFYYLPSTCLRCACDEYRVKEQLKISIYYKA